jgi:hypothetical protein
VDPGNLCAVDEAVAAREVRDMADGAEGESGPVEDGAGPSPQVLAENRQAAGSAPPKEPGWYPVRANPNEQTYWDGTDWTGRRRWSAGTGWTEVGADTLVSTAAPGAAFSGPRMSANPYAPHPTSTPPAAQFAPGVTVGVLLLMASSVAMMVGSVTTWISSSASINGTTLFRGTAGAGITVSSAVSGVADGISNLIGINGFITLIAAAAVLVFAGLMAVSDDWSVRLVGCFVALASLGLSIYAVVRLAQKLNQVHTPHGVTINVGWGVIMTLGGAVIATLVALFEVTRNR